MADLSKLETDATNELLTIGLDPEDYATAAAADASNADAEEDQPLPRTFQSEAAFLAQKASYTAKIDDWSSYSELVATFPVLDPHGDAAAKDGQASAARMVLDKRSVMRLGYAVGELYFQGRFEEVVALCRRVRDNCEIQDKKSAADLERWQERCATRLAQREAPSTPTNRQS